LLDHYVPWHKSTKAIQVIGFARLFFRLIGPSNRRKTEIQEQNKTTKETKHKKYQNTAKKYQTVASINCSSYPAIHHNFPD